MSKCQSDKEVIEALLEESEGLHKLLFETRAIALEALMIQVHQSAEVAEIPPMAMMAACLTFPDHENLSIDSNQWPVGLVQRCTEFQDRLIQYSESFRERNETRSLADLVRLTEDWPLRSKEGLH